MARSKASLIADAQARGLTLTGDETVSELVELLESAGELEAEAEAAEDVEPSKTEVAVSETAKAVAEAATALDAAKAVHEDAKVAHAEATKPPAAVLGKHFLLEGSMIPQVLPDPADGAYPRRIVINGRSYEHVSDAAGVNDAGEPATIWVYRSM